MTRPRLTDAELDALLDRLSGCAELPLGDAMQVAQVTKELRELRADLAAAELRESIWREGLDSTFELAQQNAKLVAALERLNEAATKLANDHTSSVVIKEFIAATRQADDAIASAKGEQDD